MSNGTPANRVRAQQPLPNDLRRRSRPQPPDNAVRGFGPPSDSTVMALDTLLTEQSTDPSADLVVLVNSFADQVSLTNKHWFGASQSPAGSPGVDDNGVEGHVPGNAACAAAVSAMWVMTRTMERPPSSANSTPQEPCVLAAVAFTLLRGEIAVRLFCILHRLVSHTSPGWVKKNRINDSCLTTGAIVK